MITNDRNLSTLRNYAQQWVEVDPDPLTRAQGAALLANAGPEGEPALFDHFGSRLTFGTAGLRAEMGVGPNRMNRIVVMQTAAAVARRVLDDGPEEAQRGIVIGFDGRHNSDIFALDSARVIAALGVPVRLFSMCVPTPVLAFAVTHFGCAAGIAVTASHNPAADNGYKIYWGDGPQIVPPLDTEISAHIESVAELVDGKVVLPAIVAPDHKLITSIGNEVVEAYVAAISSLDPHTSEASGRSKLKIVYTAMHGVGAETLLRVFGEAGYTDVNSVEAQRHPDPDFKTVAFPNPEEPGALELAIALATDVAADLIIANDPDADRLSIAIPNGNGFRQLRGDEVGTMLGEHLLRLDSERQGEQPEAQCLVATTIVSSSLLGHIAKRWGASFNETLTGFKWLGRNALGQPHLRHILSYEEALGYSVGQVIRDKDGISAALVVADMAASMKAGGSSIAEFLGEIDATYGRFDTAQQSIRFDGPSSQEQIGALMNKLRASRPENLGGFPVVGWRDLLAETPSTDVVVIRVAAIGPSEEAVGRIIVRPSGTEPKCKVYYEVVQPKAVPEIAQAGPARTHPTIDALWAAVSGWLGVS